MRYDVETILKSASIKPDKANMKSVITGLEMFGEDAGLLKPHRLAIYLAQIMHESGDFKYDREIWGPTPAQKRYDTRTDLGNTPAADGDGKLWMGRTPMQLTGKANYQASYDYAVKKGYNPPNWMKNPDLVNTDPWEGFIPIWFWDTKGLNKFADIGDFEMVTKRINGGLNGFEDRCKKYARVALCILDYGPNELEKFQQRCGLVADNDPGPKTRAALHTALVKLIPGEMKKASVQVAPVIEEIAKPIAVTPPALEAPWYTTKEFWTTAVTGGGLTLATGFIKDLASFPTTNLVILVGAGFLGLGGFLLYRRNLDRQHVKSEVENLEKGK